MFDFKRTVSFFAAMAVLSSLCGCMSLDGPLPGSEGSSSETSADYNSETPFSVVTTDTGVWTENTSAGPQIPQTEPPLTEPVTTTEPAISAEPPTAVSDVIVELGTVSTEARDYSSLDSESHGYGQGVHFDDLNRPRGAVEFNSGYSEYNATAINMTEEKVINLTFDQGYENGFTGKILDTLKEKGVKATFFVVGDYAEREPELVRRMIDEGHTVGSHSVNHYSMPELSEEEAVSEIMDLHRYVLENFGIQMNLFRPPKGEYSERSLAITSDLGYKTVLWSFAYADWDTDDQPDPDTALQKLIDRAHPGAIYLLHSVSETNAMILGDFIDAMLAEGYTFGCSF